MQVAQASTPQRVSLFRFPVRRQRLWDQIGDLSNEGCLAHRNPKESEDVPEILSPLPPVRRPKSCRAIFAVLRASTITPRTRSAPSWEGLASSEALKILKSSGQRRSLSRFPFPLDLRNRGTGRNVSIRSLMPQRKPQKRQPTNPAIRNTKPERRSGSEAASAIRLSRKCRQTINQAQGIVNNAG
jgi:hypothetical protein